MAYDIKYIFMNANYHVIMYANYHVLTELSAFSTGLKYDGSHVRKLSLCAVVIQNISIFIENFNTQIITHRSIYTSRLELISYTDLGEAEWPQT